MIRKGRDVFESFHMISGFNVLDLEDVDVFDFVPEIKYGTKFQDMDEEAILNNWRRHFIARDVPYIITKKGNILTLWKELEVPYEAV